MCEALAFIQVSVFKGLHPSMGVYSLKVGKKKPKQDSVSIQTLLPNNH